MVGPLCCGYALFVAKQRTSLVLIASALIVFGFTAGLTEGGAFMSRLKEHWFLIWIPLALLSSAWVINTQQEEEIAESSAL